MIELWQLAIVGFVLGIADGFFYPAYSALLPSILPADAAARRERRRGDAAARRHAGARSRCSRASRSPSTRRRWRSSSSASRSCWPSSGSRGCAPRPSGASSTTTHRHPISACSSTSRTASVHGAHAVAVRDPALRDPARARDHGSDRGAAAVRGDGRRPAAAPADTRSCSAAFGFGGAIASLVVASLKLPRRYLTIMNLLLGRRLDAARRRRVHRASSGCSRWRCSSSASATAPGTVIWGTLLQRRVPPAMLGRVSSLDFFVSLAFMPISMAIAGPVGEAIGYGWTFLLAGADSDRASRSPRSSSPGCRATSSSTRSTSIRSTAIR